MANPTPKLAAGGTLSEEDLISVVIPCFNHAHFLPEAIESVLTQNYPNFEVIVVDDGSTDNTPKIVRLYPSVCYVYQENAGLSNARNTGLQQSYGEFLIFLDADDRLLPNALETGIKSMHEHPECAFVSGHCRVIDSNGAILPSPRQLRLEHDHYLKLLRGGSYIWCPATVFYQRRIFDFVHGFDTALRRLEDYELYLRITRDFPVYSHNQVVAEYRRHGSNMTRDVSAQIDTALAAHAAQWHFIKGDSHYREAYNAGKSFWQNDYPIQQMVSKIREIVRAQLPPDAIVTVATGGSSELLRLDGRRAWHFPQSEQSAAGDLFAQGTEGSITTPAWIEPGMTYEFGLYGGPEFSRLLARVLVRGVADSLPTASTESVLQESSQHDGALLTAIPNPVPASEQPGATNIIWSTGDGSEGRLYVSGAGVYSGHDPADSDEAWSSLEFARQKGAEYLIIPAKSFFWGDQFEKFRAQVEACYPILIRVENTCIIFDVRQAAPASLRAKIDAEEARIEKIGQ